MGINSFLDNWSYNRLMQRQPAFSQQNYINPFANLSINKNLPSWVALSEPAHYESAARFNPIVKGAINLLATAASNGKKYLTDASTGEEIPWTDKRDVVQKIKKLLVQRPNPLQSGREYEKQGVFYFNTFGNRYVYGLMPSGFDSELDIMNIEALWNLPSQFMQVRTTGKLYKQTQIKDIISSYARVDSNPIEMFDPVSIMHYNEVNISSEMSTIMGISKLEVLKNPIKNTQLVFEAIDVLLTQGGSKGIISVDSRDGTGSIVPLQPKEKEEVNNTFKNDYGFLNGQNPFLVSPVPLTFTKTAMTSKELGLYEEFSNNSILISNEFNIPPELLKTYIQGATYENQEQSVKRLYQDTVIPQKEDDDQYTNHRLNLEKYGVVLNTRWDHIPALAENEKDKATSNSLNVKSALMEYEKNTITWNQYLNKTSQPPVTGGDVYFYQREALTNPNPNPNNG